MTFGSYTQFNTLGMGFPMMGGYSSYGGCGLNSNGALGFQLAYALSGVAGMAINAAVASKQAKQAVPLETQLKNVQKQIDTITDKLGVETLQSASSLKLEERYNTAVTSATQKVENANDLYEAAKGTVKEKQGAVDTAKQNLKNASPEEKQKFQTALAEAEKALNLAKNDETSRKMALDTAKKELKAAEEAKKNREKQIAQAQTELDKLFNEKKKLEAEIANDKTAKNNQKLFDKVDGDVKNRATVDELNQLFAGETDTELKDDAEVSRRTLRAEFNQYRLAEEDGNEEQSKLHAKRYVSIYNKLSGQEKLSNEEVKVYMMLKSKYSIE